MSKKEYCILAGGCFWCVAQPYYECDGVVNVYSGYTGGTEINPKYEDVKAQLTSHKEAVKIEYDSEVLSYKDILDIYFKTIDPFDFGGQFIDRGNSYTCTIYYHNDQMLELSSSYIKSIEDKYNKKVAVSIEKEKTFYMAEEYHQDYALKNPEAMEKELIESGRKNNHI